MSNKGFTLVEMMVVVAIVAIIAAIAIPSLSSFIASTKLSAQANDLVAAVSYARSEAVKRNATVSLCSSSDGATCASGSGWSGGWLVQLADGTILQVYSTPQSGNTLTASVAGALSFLPSGQSSGLILNLCGSSGSRSVQISTTGRVQVTNPATGCS